MIDPFAHVPSHRILIGLALALALAACGSGDTREPAPEPSSTETGVQNSIIRDDLEDTAPLPPPAYMGERPQADSVARARLARRIRIR